MRINGESKATRTVQCSETSELRQCLQLDQTQLLIGSTNARCLTLCIYDEQIPGQITCFYQPLTK